MSLNNVPKLYSREHSCFCDMCMNGRYADCTHHTTTGPLRSEIVLKLPYKDAPARKTPAVGDMLEKANYFKARFVSGGNQQTIVAILVENKHENVDPFKMAMVTKTANS